MLMCISPIPDKTLSRVSAFFSNVKLQSSSRIREIALPSLSSSARVLAMTATL